MNFHTFSVPAFLAAAILIPLAAGGVFLPFIALAFRTAEAGGKKFYNNMARQTVQAGLACGVLATAAALGARYFYGSVTIEEWYESALTQGLFSEQEVFLIAGLSAGALLLQALSLLIWKKTRQQPFFQIFLLLAVVVAIAAGFALAPGLLRAFFDPTTPVLGETYRWFLHFSQGSVADFDYHRIFVFPASVAAAGALAVCWPLLRRNADDFGRDYYNFAVSRACGAALFFGVLTLLAYTASAAFYLYNLPALPDALYLAFPLAGLALLVVSCVIWLLACKSKTPLRHKAGLWLCLIFWSAACGLLAFF